VSSEVYSLTYVPGFGNPGADSKRKSIISVCSRLGRISESRIKVHPPPTIVRNSTHYCPELFRPMLRPVYDDIQATVETEPTDDARDAAGPQPSDRPPRPAGQPPLAPLPPTMEILALSPLSSGRFRVLRGSYGDGGFRCVNPRTARIYSIRLGDRPIGSLTPYSELCPLAALFGEELTPRPASPWPLSSSGRSARPSRPPRRWPDAPSTRCAHKL